MTPSQSPLPWKARGERNKFWGWVIDGPEVQAIGAFESQTDAERAAHRVNTYDALVEALQVARALLCDSKECDCLSYQASVKADEALKQAGVL